MKSDNPIVNQLQSRGVQIPNPASIEIGPDVDPDRISGEGVVVHSGCKIFGRWTLIGPGVELGREAPVTIEDCRLGKGVKLKGGYFRQAVFLEGSGCGSGAHVREGTILEEHTSIAHTVGLKHTILFPFVTLGSLINLCDCLMAGGTGPRDHSEVGSSYIHFNFTPNQDKATPSLIGEVPRGVMINQRPIFLGGQGGMVGPLRLSYGTTVAAGTILRKDELRPNRLIIGGAGQGGNIETPEGRYPAAERILRSNLVYLGNIAALRQWYLHVRSMFVGPHFHKALHEGLIEMAELAYKERTHRLKEVIDKVAASGNHSYARRWASLEAGLRTLFEYRGDERGREKLKNNIHSLASTNSYNYIKTIQSLSISDAQDGTAWLQGIVDHALAMVTTTANGSSG
jgi:bifunctional UDP-N-acetylglucosamine pyrophosphorylase / glucosamine-1-phosphate N-acetyltransferase